MRSARTTMEGRHNHGRSAIATSPSHGSYAPFQQTLARGLIRGSNECKRRKIKCNGQTPCQRCGNLNLDCQYAPNCCNNFKETECVLATFREHETTADRRIANSSRCRPTSRPSSSKSTTSTRTSPTCAHKSTCRRRATAPSTRPSPVPTPTPKFPCFLRPRGREVSRFFTLASTALHRALSILAWPDRV